ncbi:hypothetical protein BGZ61DRAFT_535986 [Ilyonectria robusta]|uniref:uncharacterized protein n=1 Tax=Ilyonectria robusta TaxID=1079257 RepID=UPI001E8DC13A|nr:uncharacterized protein BGZ61DRAFT_535986 [Ilyonectria robusta]KAH8677026.1 hypothetical protein BGZ61DRAFT_535986 [Ilyonectria robusta]
MARYVWGHLPPEIQLIILRHLAQAEYDDRASLVSYSTVCKSWRPVFEELTFQEIYVKTSEIKMFQKLFRTRRRKYVQYIKLKLEFAKHQAPPTKNIATENLLAIANNGIDASPLLPVLEREQMKDNIRFTKTLWAFLSHLSLWDRNETCGGISLEITTYSPSYSKKMLRAILEKVASGWALPKPASITSYTWARCIYAAAHNFHFSLDFDSSTLPRVAVISRFSIGAGATRNFEPRAVAMLLQSFPSIKEFDLHMRVSYEQKTSRVTAQNWVKALDSWPSSLKTVRLHHIPGERNRSISQSPFLTPLGQRLAQFSQQLEHFYVPYSIDAQGFFSANVLQWGSLERLILWSIQDILDELPNTTNMLIRSAAHEALRMLSIRFLIIYSLDNYRGAIFCYEVVNEGVRISVKCSHPFRLDEACKKDWEYVAREHNQGYVEWRIAELPVDVIDLAVGGVVRKNVVRKHPTQGPVRARRGRRPKRRR